MQLLMTYTMILRGWLGERMVMGIWKMSWDRTLLGLGQSGAGDVLEANVLGTGTANNCT
jgi:hypothetical protein